jgi:hypothetical protein
MFNQVPSPFLLFYCTLKVSYNGFYLSPCLYVFSSEDFINGTSSAAEEGVSPEPVQRSTEQARIDGRTS